jgi:hypothetical protein
VMVERIMLHVEYLAKSRKLPLKMQEPNVENGLKPKRGISLDAYRVATTLAYKSNLLPTFDLDFHFLFLSLNSL